MYHATRGCHFDNYPNDDWAGKSRARTVYSDCMKETVLQISQAKEKEEGPTVRKGRKEIASLQGGRKL